VEVHGKNHTIGCLGQQEQFRRPQLCKPLGQGVSMDDYGPVGHDGDERILRLRGKCSISGAMVVLMFAPTSALVRVFRI